MREAPERCFERFDAIARTLDAFDRLRGVVAACQRRDLLAQGRQRHGGKDRRLAFALQRCAQLQREKLRALDGLLRAVRGACAFAGLPPRRFGARGVEHRHWREPHQRAVACRARIGVARERIARCEVAGEGTRHREADVEAASRAAHVAHAAPVAVAVHLVGGIEGLAMDQARREAQRHRGVVGPFAGDQAERSAAAHVGDGLERAARAELQRGAHRIAAGQPEQAPLVARRVHGAAPSSSRAAISA
ncbi:hypothetical protein D3C85_1219390 [compost metagenome]